MPAKNEGSGTHEIPVFAVAILFSFNANAQVGRDTANQPQELSKGEKGSSIKTNFVQIVFNRTTIKGVVT